jgi:3-dehydroquinate dehydratase
MEYRRYRNQPQHDFEETWPSKMVRSIARKMQQSEK